MDEDGGKHHGCLEAPLPLPLHDGHVELITFVVALQYTLCIVMYVFIIIIFSLYPI